VIHDFFCYSVYDLQYGPGKLTCGLLFGRLDSRQVHGLFWQVFRGLSQSRQKKFQDITSLRTAPLPPKPFTFHNSSYHQTCW
jgi:hypothetical protein